MPLVGGKGRQPLGGRTRPSSPAKARTEQVQVNRRQHHDGRTSFSIHLAAAGTGMGPSCERKHRAPNGTDQDEPEPEPETRPRPGPGRREPPESPENASIVERRVERRIGARRTNVRADPAGPETGAWRACRTRQNKTGSSKPGEDGEQQSCTGPAYGTQRVERGRSLSRSPRHQLGAERNEDQKPGPAHGTQRQREVEASRAVPSSGEIGRAHV